MSRKLLLFAVLLALTVPAFAGQKTSTTDHLTALLHEFLAGVSKNDNSVYDRFFADDLIYTRSAGSTITKADILKSLDEPPKPDEPKSAYDADDITVHAYGNMAVMNFRLIQRLTNKDSSSETHYYRNTGTFLKRNGRWQVVAWQATRVPGEQPKSDKTSYVPPRGFVPDAATAIRIAEAVWTPIYGAKQLASERPFKARLEGELWIVKGSLPKGWTGGVAEAHIAKPDGRILKVIHGQ